MTIIFFSSDTMGNSNFSLIILVSFHVDYWCAIIFYTRYCDFDDIIAHSWLNKVFFASLNLTRSLFLSHSLFLCL